MSIFIESDAKVNLRAPGRDPEAPPGPTGWAGPRPAMPPTALTSYQTQIQCLCACAWASLCLIFHVAMSYLRSSRAIRARAQTRPGPAGPSWPQTRTSSRPSWAHLHLPHYDVTENFSHPLTENRSQNS